MKYVYIYGGAIGDSLLGIHMGRVLSQSLPNQKIVLISTRKNAFVRELVSSLPFVEYHEVIKTNPFSWGELLCLTVSKNAIALIEPSDVPIPLWWRIILFAGTLVAGSREVHGEVVGHSRTRNKKIDAVVITPSESLFTVFVPDVIRAWGVTPLSVAPSLARETITDKQQPYILFHFFAGNYRRSFPIEKARPLLMQARNKFPSYEFVVSASPAEHERVLAMAKGISNTRIASDLSASQMILLLQQASLTVGVASGITHIAAHLDVPTIVLANLSDPYWLPTYNEKIVLLSDKEHCACNGNKSGLCVEHTPGGDVFRCLYYVPNESILDEMEKVLLA